MRQTGSAATARVITIVGAHMGRSISSPMRFPAPTKGEPISLEAITRHVRFSVGWLTSVQLYVCRVRLREHRALMAGGPMNEVPVMGGGV